MIRFLALSPRLPGLSLLLMLSACSTILTPLGSENYDCNRKENPASPYCHSFRSVENGTNAPLPDSRYDTAVKMSEVDRLTGIAPSDDGRSGADAILHPPASAGSQQPRPVAAKSAVLEGAEPVDGTPVRVAPLIQRTWVKRHVEAGDRLVGSTYLYKEIVVGHWQGFVNGGQADGRLPVRPHRPADASVTPLAQSAVKSVSAAASRLGSSNEFSQPGVQTPGGGMGNAPPIDGASMPQ